MKRLFTLFLAFLAICTGFTSCTKDADYVLNIDYNTIAMVVADNENLSIFNAGLRPIGLHETLQKKGPFTVLVPSDDAFTKKLWNKENIQLLSSQNLSNLMQYHVIEGTYRLNELSFLFNQEVRSQKGKLYVTRWVKEKDTVLTINGSRVLTQNLPTSNGIIHIIDQVLEPFKHERLTDAIADDPQLTFFKEALRTSGVETLLASAGEYTVYAPNNAAMKAEGFPTIEAINASDPATLRKLINYHIVPSRRFVYDYVLTTDKTNSSQQNMLDGLACKVTLLADPWAPGSYTGISLQGPGNTQAIKLLKQDVLTGNGILHTINGILKATR